MPNSPDGRRAPARGTPALLSRSDLPPAAKVAVAATSSLLPVVVVAVIVAVAASWLGWPMLEWAAIAVALAWFVCAGVAGGVTTGARGAAGGLAAGVSGAWALAAGVRLLGLSLLFIGGGLLVGAAIRWFWDRRQRDRERRLAALPDWSRDELGDVAAHLDPSYGRKPGPPVVGEYADSAVRLLAAVCRPLHGSTVLAGRPAVAVNGSRVAVLVPAAAAGGDLPPLPRLPRGATARVFVLREGTELDDRAIAEIPGAGAEVTGEEELSDEPAVTYLVASEPHELAAHLAAGTPPDGDATTGIAADLHSRVLRALGGYAGRGER